MEKENIREYKIKNKLKYSFLFPCFYSTTSTVLVYACSYNWIAARGFPYVRYFDRFVSK